jgi:hypothetical protein
VSDVDRIAQILREHHFVTELQIDGRRLYHCEKCCGTKVCTAHSVEEYRTHLAAEIVDALHPRIDTVEQLDALQDGVVLIDARLTVWERNSHYGSDAEPWWCTASEIEYPSARIELPARVLYTPEGD